MEQRIFPGMAGAAGRSLSPGRSSMPSHEVTITPVTGKDEVTVYEITVVAGSQTRLGSYETLESALDSFDPPLTERVRSHVVESVRGEGKACMFCLEDSLGT
jgi:hypothetical protein